MQGLEQRWRRARLLLTTAIVAPPLLGGVIVALPKDPSFAAPLRLALAMSLFAIAAAGVVCVTLAWRRFRELTGLRRWGHASSAVRDSLSYLKEEQRLATRGQVPALTGAISLSGLAVLAHWPQAAALAPYAPLFGWSAADLLICV